jgi:hypothetical protein
MIKTARLKWLGHISRKKNYIFGMQIIFTQPEVSILKRKNYIKMA